MKYKVNIEYLVPEFAEVELEAEDEYEASSKAVDIFSKENPEAQDITVISKEGFHVKKNVA